MSEERGTGSGKDDPVAAEERALAASRRAELTARFREAEARFEEAIAELLAQEGMGEEAPWAEELRSRHQGTYKVIRHHSPSGFGMGFTEV